MDQPAGKIQKEDASATPWDAIDPEEPASGPAPLPQDEDAELVAVYRLENHEDRATRNTSVNHQPASADDDANSALPQATNTPIVVALDQTPSFPRMESASPPPPEALEHPACPDPTPDEPTPHVGSSQALQEEGLLAHPTESVDASAIPSIPFMRLVRDEEASNPPDITDQCESTDQCKSPDECHPERSEGSGSLGEEARCFGVPQHDSHSAAITENSIHIPADALPTAEQLEQTPELFGDTFDTLDSLPDTMDQLSDITDVVGENALAAETPVATNEAPSPPTSNLKSEIVPAPDVPVLQFRGPEFANAPENFEPLIAPEAHVEPSRIEPVEPCGESEDEEPLPRFARHAPPPVEEDEDEYDQEPDLQTEEALAEEVFVEDPDNEPDFRWEDPELDGELEPARSGGGWTIPILCLGIALIACCVVIPQADANRRLAYEKMTLTTDLETIQKQVAVNEEFLKKVVDDPSLAERLAQRQLKQVRKGQLVLKMREEKQEMSPFAITAVSPPPPPPPYKPIGGVIANTCYNARSRLYLMGIALVMIACGLVLGVAPPRTESDSNDISPQIDEENETGT